MEEIGKVFLGTSEYLKIRCSFFCFCHDTSQHYTTFSKLFFSHGDWIAYKSTLSVHIKNKLLRRFCNLAYTSGK